MCVCVCIFVPWLEVIQKCVVAWVTIACSDVIVVDSAITQERPYHDDNTASRLFSEVKHHRARLVLRWGTTLESRVLFFLFS